MILLLAPNGRGVQNQVYLKEDSVHVVIIMILVLVWTLTTIFKIYHYTDTGEDNLDYGIIRSYGGWWNHGLQPYSGLYSDGGLGSLSWYRGSHISTNNHFNKLSLS